MLLEDEIDVLRKRNREKEIGFKFFHWAFHEMGGYSAQDEVSKCKTMQKSFEHKIRSR